MKSYLKRNPLRSILTMGVLLIILLYLMFYHSNPKPLPLNPHPRYFITLHGHIAPEYKNKITPVFQQEFASWSAKCTYTSDWLEGVPANPVRTVNYFPKPDSHGNYTLKIPTDRFLPGMCDWRALDLSVNLTNDSSDRFPWELGIYGKGSDKANSKVTTYYCYKNGSDCTTKVGKHALTPMQYYFNKSYDYTINFLYKEGNPGNV